MADLQYTQDPDARLDYTINWEDYLAGEIIQTSVWAIEDPPDALLEIDEEVYTSTTATVWLVGGTVDHVYRVRNRITTSLGRIDDREFLLRIGISRIQDE